jgi:pyruvate formate lyase activating enzyme
MGEGGVGFCRVRQVRAGRLETLLYGRTSGFCVDPVEKKPLFHFLPGSRTLSFGTASCNLGCIFCQNWSITKRDLEEALTVEASPAGIAQAALKSRCESVSFTYNEPIISAEFTIDSATCCREAGLKTIAVTSGYISGEARSDFFSAIDAANVDLKGFTDGFYRRYCGASLSPVLETLEFIRRETATWLEITTLVIPGANDDDVEMEDMTRWIFNTLGADTPLHLSAFHPDYHLLDCPPTPPQTLLRARDIAMKSGLKYVYVGNLRTSSGSHTFCPTCQNLVVERRGFEVISVELRQGKCPSCGTVIPGLFCR